MPTTHNTRIIDNTEGELRFKRMVRELADETGMHTRSAISQLMMSGSQFDYRRWISKILKDK